MKILVIGGYGIFGGRVVELLEDEPRLTLIVAGRSRARAEAFCAARGEAKATLLAAQLDRNGNLTAQLESIGPDLVVDASGPFQAYGDAPYRVIEACIAHGIDYLDLADGSGFVPRGDDGDDFRPNRGIGRVGQPLRCAPESAPQQGEPAPGGERDERDKGQHERAIPAFAAA